MAVSESGQGGLQATTYAEEQEHAIVGGVAAKKVFPIDLPPTAQTNGSIVLGYDGSGNLTTITKTIGTVQYRKTLTYNGSNVLTDISVWVQL